MRATNTPVPGRSRRLTLRLTTGLVAAISIVRWLAGEATHAQMIGEVGYLKGPEGAGSVPVFVDRKALDAYYEANARNDYEDGMRELFNAGKLYMVDVGTKVRVLDTPGFLGSLREIRILEGEFNGRRGFVSGQWVVPAGSDTKQNSKKTETTSVPPEPLTTAPTPTVSPELIESQNRNQAAGDSFRVKFNQEFTLGDYSYEITKAQFFGSLNFKPSNSPHRQFKAPDGAMYVLIDYVMRYDGKQTVAAKPCSFRLVGSEGREYEPDDTVLDVVRGSGRVVRSNHPGVSTPTYTVFLVPQNASPFTLTVRENADEPNRKMAALDLQFNAASPTPKSKPTNKKQTARRNNVDEITPEQRELWRRMDRPWGTPWRSFSSEDEHGYPNN